MTGTKTIYLEGNGISRSRDNAQIALGHVLIAGHKKTCSVRRAATGISARHETFWSGVLRIAWLRRQRRSPIELLTGRRAFVRHWRADEADTRCTAANPGRNRERGIRYPDFDGETFVAGKCAVAA